MRTTTVVGTALAVLLGSTAARAQTPTPAATPEATPAATAAPKAPELPKAKVGGYVQVAARYFPQTEPETDFARGVAVTQIPRARVYAKGDLLPDVSYNVMLEVRPPTPALTDGWVQYTKAGQSLRVGQFKTPFGWENPTSATKLPTLDRSLLSTRIPVGSGTLRDIGVMFHGAVPVGPLKIEHALAIVDGNGQNRTENNNLKDGYARVGVVYGKNLVRAGISGGRTAFEKPDNSTPPVFTRESATRYGVDVEVDTSFLFAVVEVQQAVFEDPADVTSNGGYLLLVGKLPAQTEAVLRVEQLDPNTDTDDDELQRIVVGANWYPLTQYRDTLRVCLHYRRDTKPADVHEVIGWMQLVF